MNKLYTLVALVLLMNGARAEEGYYAGATGGLVVPTSLVYIADLDFGWRGGVFVGYQFGNQFRVEGELVYSRCRVETAWTDSLEESRARVHTESLAALGNVLYEIPLTDRFSTYLGGGLGYGRHQTIVKWPSEPTDKVTKNGFVWQGIVGMSYAFDRYKWGVDYRNIHFGGRVSDHTLNLSVSRSF